MLPIVIVLICIGWRILKRKKAEEKEDEEFYKIKHRPLDPDESMKINSDEEESIPYKKDVTEDSPEPTEPVKVVSEIDTAFPYGESYDQTAQPNATSNRQWTGETEIN